MCIARTAHTPICIIAYACMHVLAHNQCCSAEPRVHCMVVYQTGPPRLYRPGEPNLTLSNSCASTTLRNCRNFLLLLLKSFLQLRCSACAASLAANTARAASSHFAVSCAWEAVLSRLPAMSRPQNGSCMQTSPCLSFTCSCKGCGLARSGPSRQLLAPLLTFLQAQPAAAAGCLLLGSAASGRCCWG